MGFSEKAQVVEGGLESDNSSSRKWVIAGIALRAPLKPIYTTTTTTTTPLEKEQQKEEGETTTEECSTTPTGEESRIPTTFTCPPPAPRKRKPPLKCNYRGVVREFFTPPELETVFIRHVERAS